VARRTPARAFTLIELMVSIAVVLLLMTVVIAILNSATSVTKKSRKNVDADNEARMVFDRMSADFGRMVTRPDVDYIFGKGLGGAAGNGSNDACFFYSEAPALATTTNVALQSAISLIGYRINPKYQLERLGKGLVLGAAPPDGMIFLNYSNSNSTTSTSTNTAPTPDPTTTLAVTSSVYVGAPGDNPPYSSGTSPDFHVIGPNVFRLEFCFLLKPYKKSDGTVAPATYSTLPYNATQPEPNHYQYGTGLRDVQAIVVSNAILDPVTRKIISPDNLAALSAALADADAPAGSLTSTPPVLMAQTWDDQLNLKNFTGILKTAAANVHVYQRTFYFSPFLN
jgi:prepilin-type N-terminal cleavage/methylation domain-containing protein